MPRPALLCLLRRALYRGLARWRTWPLEWYLATASTWTGALILATEPSAHLRDIAHAPSWGVGSILLLHGLMSLRAVWTRRPDLCRRAALVSVGLWTGMAALVLATPPANLLTVGLTSCPAGASAWVYLRLVWIVGGAR